MIDTGIFNSAIHNELFQRFSQKKLLEVGSSHISQKPPANDKLISFPFVKSLHESEQLSQKISNLSCYFTSKMSPVPICKNPLASEEKRLARKNRPHWENRSM